MKIKIVLKAWLPKLWDGEKERWIEVPEGTTCEQALESQGIYYQEISRFGFVSLNGKRVLIDHLLQDGDEMNVFPRMNGG
jgi:sulfur carrier protein ThiS